jgi:hypothetical protein
MKRRRLTDLYVRGRDVTFDEHEGEPVVVWLQKLNEVDRQSVVRRSHAAKARFLLEGDKEDTEVFQSMYSQIRTIDDRDTLFGILTSEELIRARARIEAQLATDEETWGKDNYLQSLYDAWVGTDDEPGLAAAKAEDENDPEALRVEAELDRFETEVAERLEAEADQIRTRWDHAASDELWREAAHRLIVNRSDEIFLAEFERQSLFYCTREPDQHDRRYFSTVTEIDDLDPSIRTRLQRELQDLTVTPAEGKDSRANRDSSTSPEASPEPTPDSSGPETAEPSKTSPATSSTPSPTP